MADLVPTQITQQQVGFAPEVAPYAQDLLGRAQALTDFTKFPYQQYMGERFAQFTPLQQQAFAGAQAMEAAPQLADASALAGQAGLRALGYNQYQPGQFGNFFQAVPSYQPTAFTAPGVGTRSFTASGMADQYMNPYMSAVQQQLQRQADIQRSTLGAQAAKSGAFGGARTGLMNQQLNAELMRQQQQAQAQAFGQAQQQFNVEQQAGLQAQLANQQARMQAQQQAEQSRQFGYGQLMQQAGLGAQYGQAAAQLGEQSRQYGAGLGLQGLQTALQGAQQLGGLGSTQFGQNLALNQLQAQYGQQQQQRAQDVYNAQYQDFLNFQNYPYKQLGFMSDIINRAPLTQTGATVYAQPPSTLGTLAGLGLGAYSMFGKKEGGEIKAYAEGGLSDSDDTVDMAFGGSVMDDQFVESVLSKLSTQQLTAAYQNALNARDAHRAELIQSEIERRRSEEASFTRGIAAVAPSNMEEMLPSEESMRKGGIIAFADRGAVEDTSPAPTYEGLEALGKEVEALRAQVRSAPGSRQMATDPEVRAKYEAARAALPRKEQEYQDYALRFDPSLGRAAFADVKSPATGKRVQPETAPSLRVPATSSAAAPELPASLRGQNKMTPEQIAAQPSSQKDVAKVASVVSTAMASQTGVPKEDLEDTIFRVAKKLDNEDKELFAEIRGYIDKLSKRPEEIRKGAVRDALGKFGFAMAAEASKVGTGAGVLGALRAAGAAGPVAAEAMAKSEEAARAAEDIATKMRLEQARYETQLRKGNRQTAMQHATNIRQLQVQMAQVQATREHYAQTGAFREKQLAQQGEQFKQTLGLRGLQSAAQLAASQARIAKVRGDLIEKFDAVNRPLKKQLLDQYGTQKGEYMYNQKRNNYVQEQFAGMPGASSSEGDRAEVPNVFDLLRIDS